MKNFQKSVDKIFIFFDNIFVDFLKTAIYNDGQNYLCYTKPLGIL